MSAERTTRSPRLRGPARSALSGRVLARGQLLGIFVLALCARAGLVLAAGGYNGIAGYDPGVYYAAAAALVNGRLPYADFVLLHPPGLMLALSPFAALGRLAGDRVGFAVAMIGFEVLGATGAVLVAKIGRELGLDRRAIWVGSALYAVWLGSAGAEVAPRLEPLGNVVFLLAVLRLARSGVLGRGASLAPRDAGIFGALLGVLVSIKIWWILPSAILAAFAVSSGSRRRITTRNVLAGAAAAVAVVDGPFAALSGRVMLRMIVQDQMSRARQAASLLQRWQKLLGLDAAWLHRGTEGRLLAAASVSVASALLLAAVVTVLVDPRYRVVAVCAAAQVLTLMAVPVYFGFYADFVAPSLALTVACALSRGARAGRRLGVARSRARYAVGWIALVAAAGATVASALDVSVPIVRPFPAGLAKAVVGKRCVMADSPAALIELDTLSRDLHNGCPNWVDVTGRTYDVDAAANRAEPRTHNVRWQCDVWRYLDQGQAVITIRQATGLSAHTERRIARLPVLGRAGGFVVHATAGP